MNSEGRERGVGEEGGVTLAQAAVFWMHVGSGHASRKRLWEPQMLCKRQSSLTCRPLRVLISAVTYIVFIRQLEQT